MKFAVYIDFDPEDSSFTFQRNMMLSSDDEPDESFFDEQYDATRKHIVYQTCLVELIKQVVLKWQVLNNKYCMLWLCYVIALNISIVCIVM